MNKIVPTHLTSRFIPDISQICSENTFYLLVRLTDQVKTGVNLFYLAHKYFP